MISILFAALVTHAAPISTACTPAEMLLFRNKEMIASLAPRSRLSAVDCEPLPGDRLAVLTILVGPRETESYLRVFNRKGMSVRSKPVYQSRALGLDTFPMNVGRRNKLLFVSPTSTKDRVEIWMNTQTGPHTTRFAHWSLDLKRRQLHESPKRGWLIDTATKPGLIEKNGKWRAAIGKRSVEL